MLIYLRDLWFCKHNRSNQVRAAHKVDKAVNFLKTTSGEKGDLSGYKII